MASSSKTRSSSPTLSFFKPGTLVEVSSDDDGFRGSFFTGKIVRRLIGDKFTVEYDNLVVDENSTKRLKETTRLCELRPIPPKEINREFKFGDEVDAYLNDGWWEGHITGVLEDGRKTVYFRVSRHQLEFSDEELRLHREWVDGGWVPPFPQQDDDSEIKEKVCVKAAETVTGDKDNFELKVGDLVEVRSDEDGFKGAWFSATLVEPKAGWKFVVEYESLLDDDSKLLREDVSPLKIRPRPPKIDDVDQFKLLDEVDTYYNDGWRVGVVSKVLGDSKYIVYFKNSNEELEFEHSQLRLHQEWVNNKWVMASKDDDGEIKEKVCVKAAETVTGDEDNFELKEGDLVEVRSDEDGFKGAWFSATLVEPKAGWKFLVEYESLLDDDSKLLREEVSPLKIRPRPPKTDEVDQFKLLDEVDTYYKDGWWVGVVSKVLGDSKYIVYFKNSNEELEFEHSQLRLHQEWVNNKWVMASKAL